MPASISKGMLSPIGPLSKLAAGIRANTDLGKGGAALGRGPNLQSKLTAAPWAGTWPAPGATLDLDFANDRGFVRGVGNGKSMDAVTFTRASSGNWVDNTGTLRTGNGTFVGSANASGVNLLSVPQNFEYWVKTRSVVTANSLIAPDGTLTAGSVIGNSTGGATNVTQSVAKSLGVHTFSVYVKAGNVKRVVIGQQYSSAGLYSDNIFDLNTLSWVTTGAGTPSLSYVFIGNGWYRLIITINIVSAGNCESYVGPINNNGTLVTSTSTGNYIFIWGAQLELGSSATTYYPTNINTPRFDWASTASTGAGTAVSPYVIPLQATPTCNGLLIEESRTNRALWCRDATQASWTKSSITAAKDQTGIDGIVNTASSLTASAADGTCIQTVTLASGSRTSSIYLKRLTGTGNIQVTLDGSTWSTVDLSNGLWNRIVLSETVTNPCIGVLIATSGDAVAMDFAQIEDGTFVTSPILTTSATVTRSQDSASILSPIIDGLLLNGMGTIYCESLMPPYVAAGSTQYALTASDNANYATVYRDSLTTFRAIVRVPPNLSIATFPVGSLTCKTAVRVQADNIGFGINGVLAAPSKGALSANIRRLNIGSNYLNTAHLNTCIKRLVYIPKAISDSGIQSMTGDFAW